MNRKLLTKVVSLSLAAAMVLSMAPINVGAAKKKNTAKPKSWKVAKSSTIKVGQTKRIAASKKAKKSKKDVKYVNFKPKNTKNINISVEPEDSTIVSVEKVSDTQYSYTGVAAGTTKLTITSKAKTAKGKKLKATMNITVINPFRVTQTGAYTFTMSTADKLEKLDKRDIKVTQEGSIVDNAVKEVKLAEDKMSVEVTMEIPFVDQKKYEVTFGKEKDSFVASVGTPAAVNIKTQSAVMNKPTEVEFAVVDAKGMDVTKTLDEAKIDLKVETKSGYYDTKSKKVTLWKVGDTAEVKVVYHTWTYDQKTGKENVVEGKGTITCVDKSTVTVTGLDKWTIADRVLSWDTDEMKTIIPEGTSSRIWVRMKKSDGSYVNNKDNKADFTFEPINTATLYVYADGSIYGTREGAKEYTKVTYFDGNVKYQYTLPITVGAKEKASALVLGQPYMSISANAGNTAAASKNTIKILNQYGDEMEALGVPTFKKLSGSDVVARLDNGGTSKNKQVQIFKVIATGEKGTGSYELSLADLKITLVVSAADVSSAAQSYRLEAELNTVDLSDINETSTNDYMQKLSDGIKLNFIETKAGLNNANADAKFKNLTETELKLNGERIKLSDNHPLIEQKPDGSLVFYPVRKATDTATVPNTIPKYYIVQTPKAKDYTIEVTRKIGDKTYTLSGTISIQGQMQMPIKDKSWHMKKVSSSDNVVGKLVSTMIANDLKKDGFTALDIDQFYYASVLGTKGNSLGNLTKTAPILHKDWKDTGYYLDSAALPSFVTDENSAIWVWMEALNEKMEAKDAELKILDFNNPSSMYGQTTTFTAYIDAYSMPTDGILTLDKIYEVKDPETDKKDNFDLLGTNVITGNLANGTAAVAIQQKNTTLEGKYMVVVKYTVGGITKTAEAPIYIRRQIGNATFSLNKFTPNDTLNSINPTILTAVAVGDAVDMTDIKWEREVSLGTWETVKDNESFGPYRVRISFKVKIKDPTIYDFKNDFKVELPPGVEAGKWNSNYSDITPPSTTEYTVTTKAVLS